MLKILAKILSRHPTPHANESGPVCSCRKQTAGLRELEKNGDCPVISTYGNVYTLVEHVRSFSGLPGNLNYQLPSRQTYFRKVKVSQSLTSPENMTLHGIKMKMFKETF